MEIIDKHICKTCNKSYSSYSSLWNHIKNIHKLNIQNNLNNSENNLNNSENNLNNSENNLIKSEKNINCRYCNKEYYNIKSRWSHEKKCQIIFNEKEQEKQINEIKIAEINSNKEIELKKLEIKKENSIIKQKTNKNPTIKI